MRWTFIVAVLISAIGLSITAAIPRAALAQSGDLNADATLTPEVISDWMITYYQAPQPKAGPRIFAKALAIDMFGGGNLMSVMGFMTGYFRDNPDQLNASFDAARTLSADDQQVILVSARLAAPPGTPEAIALDVRLDAKGRKLLAIMNEMGIHAGGQVDPNTVFALHYIWSYFFATGDTRIVLPVIAAMVPQAESGPDRGIQIVVGREAEAELGAMALGHKAIRDFCEAQIATQPPEIAVKLRKIVERADAQ